MIKQAVLKTKEFLTKFAKKQDKQNPPPSLQNLDAGKFCNHSVFNKNSFLIVLFSTIAVKIIFAGILPITSDEAYFVLWGRHLDFGYYDHTPMIGWILYLMNFTGSSAFIMRLPAIAFSSVVGIGIYTVLKEDGGQKAFLISSLYLLSPLNIFNILAVNDSPLFFFSFFSCFFLYLALKKERLLYYALSGILLGCAFLSKEIAVLLGFSYLLYFLFSQKSFQKTSDFALLFAAIFPFAALFIAYNYFHNWANILFNVFNRNKEEVFEIYKPLAFILSSLYLLTPPIAFYLVKKRKTLMQSAFSKKDFSVFLFAFLFPLLFFALISFKAVVGLHWLISFYPFMYILLPQFLSQSEIINSVKFTTFFSVAHILIAFVVLSLPISLIKNNPNYNLIAMSKYPQELLRVLNSNENNFVFAAPSYSDASILEFYSGKRTILFGKGSKYARQNDFWTDFKALNGKNILIVRNSRPDAGEYQPFFDYISEEEFYLKGAWFYFVKGYGFKYEVYKERILSAIKEEFYKVPKYLPMPKKEKDKGFIGKYF